MNQFSRHIFLWIGIAILLIVVSDFVTKPSEGVELTYSEFLQKVKDREVKTAVIDGHDITGELVSNKPFTAVNGEVYFTGPLVKDLEEAGVKYEFKRPEGRSVLMQVLISLLPLLILVGLFLFFSRQMQGKGGGGGAFSFGKSRAKLMTEDQVKVNLSDVAGVEEAKEDVAELVDFLRDPGKFQKLGAKIPRGVLMIGPPGTGKTLLARAVAGEAQVPFFSISGSDFVEMFVGVGASRVRDMFEQAKKAAPCIIFIDEIDAVGRKRGGNNMGGGGNDEREQTLNQLLVEMDGFGGNEGVIIIAATNREDVLDPALLRPGRFDRKVHVSLPTVLGREAILKVHARKVPLAEGVNLGKMARGTPGFSGADLANLVNEAALFAARRGAKLVGMTDFDEARDKIIMGAERRSLIMTEEEKQLTAWHEAGHAIVGWLMPEHDPVYKVTIIPRGGALGVTHFLPERDEVSASKRKYESKIASAYGGRIAEEMLRGPEGITSGAMGDIRAATYYARQMVTIAGLSDLGPMEFVDQQDGVWKQYSDETAHAVDQEVRKILDRCYEAAEKCMHANREKLEIMAKALLKYETLDDKQLAQIMDDHSEPDPPQDWEEPGSPSGGAPAAATPSDEPPTDLDGLGEAS